MENIYLDLLIAIAGGGSSDWGTLAERIEEWNIDVYEAADRAEEITSDRVDVGALFYEVYEMHTYDVKEWLREIAEEFEDATGVIVDVDKIDGYEPQVYENYMCTSYDDPYEFWDASSEEELQSQYLDEVIEFLLEKEVVEVDEKEVCEELLEEDEEEYEEFCDNFDEKEYLKKVFKGEL